MSVSVHNFSCGYTQIVWMYVIFTISEIKMKNHLVLLFSSPFSHSLSLFVQFVIGCGSTPLFIYFFFFFLFDFSCFCRNLLCAYPYLAFVFFSRSHSRSIFHFQSQLIGPIFTVIILSNLQYTLDYDYLYGSHAQCVPYSVCLFWGRNYSMIFFTNHCGKKTSRFDETNRVKQRDRK